MHKGTMKLSTIIVVWIMLSVGMGLCAVPAGSSGEFQITIDPYSQDDPAIYGDTVVWSDKRHGNWDIYGYSLITREEFPVTTNPYSQGCPAIYGDTVVWQDKRNGNWDIYGYNLKTNQEFEITTAPDNQENPAIYKDIVVWQDYRSGRYDIYGYSLKTNQEFQITTDPETQDSPAIFEDYIMWEDWRNDEHAIYGYNLLTREEFPITDVMLMSDFVVFDDMVIWKASFDSEAICAYNLSTSKEVVVFKDLWEWWFCDPELIKIRRIAVYGDIVLWSDYRSCNCDICGFNLSTNEEFQITTDEHDQFDPAIYKNMVVWVDTRNGNYDIYGYNLDTPPHTVLNYGEKLLFIRFFYGIFLVVALVCAVYKAPKTRADEHTSETVPPTEKPREFKRSFIPVGLSAAFAAICAFLGFYSAEWWASSLLIYGLIFVSCPGIFVYSAFRLKRTPYIRITNNRIIVFRTLGKIEKVKRDTVQKISIQKHKIDIVVTVGRDVRIWLFFVDKRDREALIQFFVALSGED